MIKVLNRSDWTTRLPKDAGVDLDDLIDGLPNFVPHQVLGMVVHYTGLSSPLAPTRDIPALFRSVQNNDMGPDRRYSDIMYNFGVNHFTGDVYPLRGLINKGAANGGTASNNAWVSCLVTVGVKDDFDQSLVVEAVRTVRTFVLAVYPNATQVIGHRDVRLTGCPGAPLYGLVQSGAFAQPPTPEPPPPFVCPFPAPTLREGDRGPAVYELQNHLAFWGLYDGKVTGILDNATAWGVIKAQLGLAEQGLYLSKIDGVYGPKTHDAWCESLRRIVESGAPSLRT